MSDDGHSAAGRSIIEMLWEQADIKYDLFKEMALGGATGGEKFWNMQGQLQGLVYALAKMLHTYEPTKDGMDKIRVELKARWESVEEDDEEE